MAKFDGKYIRGAVGPVIFKKTKAGQTMCSRPAPGTMKQTRETKNASDTFGMTSILSTELKNSFSSELMDLQDNTMYIRLVKILSQVIYSCCDRETRQYQFEPDSFNPLAGFEFNIVSPVVKRLGILPQMNYNKGMLSLFFQDAGKPNKLEFVKGSSYCDMTVAVTLIRLADGLRTMGPMLQEQRFDKETTADLRGKRFDFVVPDGCLCVMSMFLKFHSYKELKNNKTFSPAIICGAIITAGTYVAGDKRKWIDLRAKFG